MHELEDHLVASRYIGGHTQNPTQMNEFDINLGRRIRLGPDFEHTKDFYVENNITGKLIEDIRNGFLVLKTLATNTAQALLGLNDIAPQEESSSI